jgi:ATP adenylyltransferase
VRLASTLAAKPIAAVDRHRRPASVRNPFLPPEPALLVADVSETHLAVLNKFPVIGHHLLVVTRRYVPQTAPLDRDDMVAMLACLAEYPALAFYNRGERAGASQPHKHLQVVPLPLVDGERMPFEGDLGPLNGRVLRAPGLPFAHAVAMLPGGCLDDPEGAAEEILDLCSEALAAAAVGSGPYNLLCTRRRLFVVARAVERFEGVSVNALGFAGSLFAKSSHELAVLTAARPLDVLAAVSRPAAASAGR